MDLELVMETTRCKCAVVGSHIIVVGVVLGFRCLERFVSVVYRSRWMSK